MSFSFGSNIPPVISFYRVCMVNCADYCKNIALPDTSNRFDTHAEVGLLSTKTTLAKLKFRMTAIFQDGRQRILNLMRNNTVKEDKLVTQ